MDRVAVFVDAGYLFAQGSALLAGRKLPRSEMSLDHDAAVKALSAFAVSASGVPLLRLYWYDGTSTGPTAQHLTLAHLPDTKVRLGFVNSVGEQKGVDSLIVTDMITLARNRSISDAVLLSGDEDIRVGVQQAQEFGVRVHLIGIKPSRGSQSLFLLQEADTTSEWGAEDLAPFLACRPRASAGAGGVEFPAVAAPIAGVPEDSLETLSTEVALTLELSELASVLEAHASTNQLPRDVDRRLLGGGRAALHRDLDAPEKRRVRELFIQACRRRLAR
jgi:hypothetical protein